MTRIQNSGSFELPMTPDAAFPLFTAEGERDWVPGWSPDVLAELPQHPGLVFLTNVHGPETIWTVLESSPALLTHRYSRVTPGHTAGIVEVKLFPADNDCQVNVSYDMTALSLEGEAALDGYRGTAFATMLAEWQRLITAAVGSDQIEPA